MWRNEAQHLGNVLWPINLSSLRRRWSELAECVACHSFTCWIHGPNDDGIAWYDIAPSIDLDFVMSITNPEINEPTIAN